MAQKVALNPAKIRDMTMKMKTIHLRGYHRGTISPSLLLPHQALLIPVRRKRRA